MLKGGTVSAVPPFIALTGGMGAGKSTALAALERLGAAVISTDAVVHDLYSAPEVRDAVTARFGADIAPGGVVDRASLARRIFASTPDRAWLEQLLWPLVRRQVEAWRARVSLLQPPPRALVVEIPLLFEAGAEQTYDATVAVVADEQLRAERAGSRGHAALAQRDARQLSQEEKAARSTFVVENNGSIEQLESELSSILDILER